MAHKLGLDFERTNRVLQGVLKVTFLFAVGSAPGFSQSIKVYPSNIRIDVGKTGTVTALAFDSAGKYRTNQRITFARTSGLAATATNRMSPEGNAEGLVRVK